MEHIQDRRNIIQDRIITDLKDEREVILNQLFEWHEVKGYYYNIRDNITDKYSTD